MSVRIEIRDGIIIGKKNEEPIRYRISEKTGLMTASFCVGSKQYDPSYQSGYRYNNFYVTVPTDKIDLIKRLNLQRNSMIHLYCKFDYSKDVLAAKEAQGDKDSPNYGQSRLVNGVILTLVDIEYAGTISSKTDNKDNEMKESKESKQNHEDQSLEKRKDFSSEIESLFSPTEGKVLSSSNDIDCDLEKKFNVGFIDLDEDDIFLNKNKPPRQKRKFFKS